MDSLWNDQAILAFRHAKPIFRLWGRHNSKGRSVRLQTINLRSLESPSSQEFLCVATGIFALRQIALRKMDGYSLVYHYRRLIGGSLYPPKDPLKPERLIVSSLQIEVTFQIHGSGILHGDGMAMWLTKEHATPGPVFGSTDNFNGLGIFIDTYKNSRPGVVFPYVMGMFGNGSVPYDKDHDGKDNELGGCSV